MPSGVLTVYLFQPICILIGHLRFVLPMDPFGPSVVFIFYVSDFYLVRCNVGSSATSVLRTGACAGTRRVDIN